MNKILITAALMLSCSILPTFSAGLLSKPKRPDRAESGTITTALSQTYSTSIQNQFPHLSSAQAAKVKEISNTIQQSVGRQSNCIYLPDKLGRQLEEAKHADVFHTINSALTRLKTDRKVFESCLQGDPSPFNFFVFQGHYNQDRLELTFPWDSIDHPLVPITEGAVILSPIDHWINVITYIKKNVFKKGSLSSFDHNTGFIFQKMIEIYLLPQAKLLLESESTHEILDSVSKNYVGIANLVLDIRKNYAMQIVDCLESICASLPSIPVDNEYLTRASDGQPKTMTSNKGSRQKAAEGRGALTEQHLNKIKALKKESDAMHELIRSLRFKVLVDLFDAAEDEEKDLFSSFLPIQTALEKRHEVAGTSYDDFFHKYGAAQNNFDILKNKIGLPERKNEKGLLDLFKRTLIQYNLKQLGHLFEIENTTTAPIASPLEESTPDTMEPDEAPFLPEESVSSDKKEKEEKAPDVDGGSFDPRKDHEVHQARKAAEKEAAMQGKDKDKTPKHVLSDYELNLYTFLHDAIYHPVHRLPWDALTDGLKHHGFEGTPNKTGNGSSWDFRVTERNELFTHNEALKGAFFNVHEYKGNGPVNYKYLRYFKSGMGIFGLTEKRVSQALAEHRALQEQLGQEQSKTIDTTSTS